MFVYYYVHIDRPFEAVETSLLRMIPGLDGMAATAYRDGENLRTRIGIGRNAKPILAKNVHIWAGQPVRGDGETAVPITWEATGIPGLFPSLDADIVVAAVGADMTQLALRGSYEPPLGAFGRSLDRAVMHRVAEACVKNFVDRIAYSIENQDQLEQAR